MCDYSKIEQVPDAWLTAAEIAPILGADANAIREQAQRDPNKLGFPVVVVGTRVKIPKDGFLYFMKFGRNAP